MSRAHERWRDDEVEDSVLGPWAAGEDVGFFVGEAVAERVGDLEREEFHSPLDNFAASAFGVGTEIGGAQGGAERGVDWRQIGLVDPPFGPDSGPTVISGQDFDDCPGGELAKRFDVGGVPELGGVSDAVRIALLRNEWRGEEREEEPQVTHTLMPA